MPKGKMTIKDNTFTGEYKYSLDNKGRINIPSTFRSALSKLSNENFVITKGMDSCIVAYPLEEWQIRVEAGLRELSSTSSKIISPLETMCIDTIIWLLSDSSKLSKTGIGG